MNIEEFREYCLSKPHVTECFPFDEDTLVFKVMGKMFSLTSLSEKPFNINLKCDPELALSLRETHTCVLPGYHMSKKHWNTIIADGTVNDDVLQKWIDHSYELVVASLPLKLRGMIRK
jgi:predicted DNA-binding protein (MmcQ/YjbR family)